MSYKEFVFSTDWAVLIITKTIYIVKQQALTKRSKAKKMQHVPVFSRQIGYVNDN